MLAITRPVNVRNGVVSSRAAFIVRLRLADGRLSGAGTTGGKVCNWGGFLPKALVCSET